jgi:hypothetical protein
MGKVKGEHHHRCHLLPCTFEMELGIKPYVWLSKLVDLKSRQGLMEGPAISDESGRVFSSSNIDQGMNYFRHWSNQKRTFCQTIMRLDHSDGSDTRALNKRVRRDDIDLANHWHQVDRADGKRPTFDMGHHYAQYKLLADPFIRYTSAM